MGIDNYFSKVFSFKLILKIINHKLNEIVNDVKSL